MTQPAMPGPHVGFTGTRAQLTGAQRSSLTDELVSLKTKGYRTLHHGDCQGADAVAGEIAYMMGFWVVTHPPVKPDVRAFSSYINEEREPKDYLDRDRDIVDESYFILATPSDYHEVVRSGTWYTVRYARRQGKLGLIVFPDGSSQAL